MTYKESGVDMEAGDALVERIKPFAKRTLRPGVLAGLGALAAFLRSPKNIANRYWCQAPMAWGLSLNWLFS